MCNYWDKFPELQWLCQFEDAPGNQDGAYFKPHTQTPCFVRAPTIFQPRTPSMTIAFCMSTGLSLSTNPFVQVPSALLGRHPSPPFLWRLCWCSHAKQPIAPHSTGNISWFMWFMDIYGLLKYVDFQSSEISSLPWKTCLILTASSSLGWSHPPLMAGMQPAESPGLPLDHEAQWISISEV